MGNNGGQKTGQPGNQAGQGASDQRGRTDSGATTASGQPGDIGASEAAGHGINQDPQGQGIEGSESQGQGAQQWTGTGGPDTGDTSGASAAEVQGSQLNTPPTQPDLGAAGQQGQAEGREIT